MYNNSEEYKVLGVNYYFELWNRVQLSSLWEEVYFNGYINDLNILKMNPPSQFANDNFPICKGENQAELVKYKIGYLDTIGSANKYIKSNHIVCFNSNNLLLIREYLIQTLKEHENNLIKSTSQNWYAEGGYVACMDMLDGTSF